jgi:hypothetical protein
MYEPIYGNHVGIVVNDQDPEKRGRVQVFLPHLSNTLYSGWNDQLKDISFKTFETSQQGGITETIAQKLYAVLPWAEASVPSFGGGTSAPVNPSIGAATPNPQSNAVQAQQNPPTPISNTTQNAPVAPSANLNQSATANPNAEVIDGNSIGSSQTTPNGPSQYISMYDLKGMIQTSVASSGLVGTIPADGSNYGITSGSLEEWTNFYLAQATTESRTYTNAGTTYIMTNDSGDNGTSNGVYSISVGDIFTKGINILNPSQNVAASISYSASLIKSSANYTVTTSINGKDQTVSGQPVISGVTDSLINGNHYAGVANYWGPARPGTGPSGSYSRLSSRTGASSSELTASIPTGKSVVGYSPCRSMVGQFISAFLPNGGANGFYSQPAVGAKVWVFFYGGDIQKPVYFGVVPNGVNIAYQA